MKPWIFGLLVCFANPLVTGAEQFFERAGVTKTINAVSVLPRNTKAVPGDVITKDLALKTGRDSRAELEFPDLTITRVGANALFRFIAGQRRIILDDGVMLFHAQEGLGGGTVEAGAITAAATGTDFMVSNTKGRVKAICLDGKVLVYFTAKPKIRTGLKPGQMVDVAAGATKMPAATTINLATLIATSMLGEAGGLGPFPNQAAIGKNASNQQATSLAGRFFPGLLTQPGSQPVQAITMATAKAARNASRPSLPLPAQAPVVTGGPADVTATAPPGRTGGTGGGGTGGPAPTPRPVRPTPRPIPRPPIVTPRPTPRPPIAPP